MTGLYDIALETLKAGAPGLSDKTKEVLAGIIARKASLKPQIADTPTATIKGYFVILHEPGKSPKRKADGPHEGRSSTSCAP
jgi:hypothetical protein